MPTKRPTRPLRSDTPFFAGSRFEGVRGQLDAFLDRREPLAVAQLRALHLLAMRRDDRDDGDANAEYDPEDRDHQCDAICVHRGTPGSNAEQQADGLQEWAERRADHVGREQGDRRRERTFERACADRKSVSWLLHNG